MAATAERALPVLPGLGTAEVVTGGNLYLAHTVAEIQRWRRTLAAAWIAVLGASGGLVIPLIVAGLARQRVASRCPAHCRIVLSALVRPSERLQHPASTTISSLPASLPA